MKEKQEADNTTHSEDTKSNNMNNDTKTEIKKN
jgi:hypothetical protein